ncbi:hydrogenase iron-sulfur subunit [Halostella sp. PRR32]|uniref:hydrogenase iron-sulfur subunit n=1 Tax=Halostella sp. PRR32 TaxID=3098147 RepID=UPI002B1D8A5E|nr:hydrogenase iron-sulfur subunit [Halostella sp. PRR32]
MNTGAFVCTCGDGCAVDPEEARDSVEGVDVVASSSHLCDDGLPAMSQVIDEHDLDQLLVTAVDDGCKRRLRGLADEHDLHPEAVDFVDHRESAGWVHGRDAATEKTARMLTARHAGLREEPVSRSVSRDAGNDVVVVGDAETASALAGDTGSTGDAEVTLIANGGEYAGVDANLDDVTVERGRVTRVDGEYGEFEVTVESRVTEDCISCMDCVREGPDGMVARVPVDIAPDAPDGEWTECCPTNAIEMDGVERAIEADQVIYPAATSADRGGRIGFYTGPVDAGTVAAVERLLGGLEKPQHLDIDMDVCASGASSKRGCNECVEACPHGAVERPRIDEVEFDPVACQDCGACTSSCPTGAVRLRDPSNERIAREVEALVRPRESGGLFGGDDPIDEQVVAFVCSERADDAVREYGRLSAAGRDLSYPPVLPVRVDCTDTVGEAHALHALASGADGVAVVGCGGSCLHSGPDPKATLVDSVNAACRDLGLGERVDFFAPDPHDPDGFVDALSAFVNGLDDSPVPAGEHVATGDVDDGRETPPFDNHGWALESVRAIVDHTDPDRDVIRGLSDFGWMEVSDDCALTPTCTNMCPTDAIRREGSDLQFDHERCVNCGLCEDGCPEGAITMRDGLDLSLLPENREAVTDADAESNDPAWITVYDGEMLSCRRCGREFTSVGSAEKVKAAVGERVEGIAPDSEHSVFEYCNDCRARLHFDT